MLTVRPSLIWQLRHPAAGRLIPRLAVGAAFAFLIWLIVVISINQITSLWGSIVTFIWGIALYFLLITTFIKASQRRLTENLRKEVGDLVDSVISGVRTEPGAPTAAQTWRPRSSAASRNRSPGMSGDHFRGKPGSWRPPGEVQRRMQLATTADEKTLSSAKEVILELLPSIPRAAKRLFNRMYFLLVVAYNRDLIGEDRVSVEQLAKWAVLLDRWPQVGRAIIDNPQRIHALEAKADNEDEFSNLCWAYKLRLTGDLNAFRDFFLSKHKLAPVVYRLVYLDPNVKSPPSSGIPLSEQAEQTGQTQISPTGDMSPLPAAIAPPDGLEGTKAPVII